MSDKTVEKPKTTDKTTEELDAGEVVRSWDDIPAQKPERHSLITWAARTDIGRVRENNEDKYDFFLPEHVSQLALRGRMWAVADGMGGHNAGQIASEFALKILIRNYFAPGGSDSTEEALQAALTEANALIHSAARQFEAKAAGMGTTIVVAVVREDVLTFAHIGDSRAYLLRRGESIRQVTTDHSWVEEQVRRGAMSRDEAEESPYRNYITRSVGVEAEVEPDIVSLPLQEGDTIVLCSDGLSGYLDEEDIERVVAPVGPSQAVLDLIDEANAKGGKDNITALVLRCKAIAGYSDALM
jgi:PPM family protein phosphatase